MAALTINTARFGEISVEEDRVIHFVEPVLGFQASRRYVILDHAENSPFKWLQSVDEPELAFVVTNPSFFGVDFELELTDETLAQLEVQSPDDVIVVTIVNIPQNDPGKMTANLLGPIVINQARRQALQCVINDTRYSTKTRLIPDEVLEQQATGTKASADKGD